MASEVEIGWRTQMSGESIPWQIDLSPAMDNSDVLSSATSTLRDIGTGVLYPTGLLGDTVVSGTAVTQSVQSLVPGHNYRLVVIGMMGGSKEKGVALLLRCIF